MCVIFMLLGFVVLLCQCLGLRLGLGMELVLGGPIRGPILLNTHGQFRYGLGVPPLSGQRHTVCLFL